jgi:ElaB/YqjD/DUF883 family membrane-anchored ribosome-binding protein
MAEEQESKRRPGGADNAVESGFNQAAEAVEKLRAVVDQASRSIKDLTEASEHWVQEAQERAREVATQLREQSNRAVGTMTETVEHNPLTSMAVAFAVGFLVASLIKR